MSQSNPLQSRFASLLACLVLMALAVGLAGCDDKVEETDQGGVILLVEFTESTFRVPVNSTTVVSLETVTLDNIVAIPGGPSSNLMDIRLETLEFTYSRADTGTRVPPPFIFRLVGTVPANGQLTYTGLPIMSVDQLRNPPLSDLLFENGAVDAETGSDTIIVDVTVQAFGRTLGGEDVASERRTQTFEFVP